jgi:hypothetical protein
VLKRGGVPPDLADEVAVLDPWVRTGAHRRDQDDNGVYEDARAVELMDAWWPLALEGIFRPKLGEDLFNKVRAKMGFDDPPSGGGSAYISGWFGYVEKDLRRLLGAKLKQPLSRGYCGGRSKKGVAGCSAKLAASLRAASVVPASTLYPRGDDCATGNAQVCNDAVRFSTTGGIAVPEIHWINRPTWQQAVEVLGHRGRGKTIAQKKCNKQEKKRGKCGPKKKGKGKKGKR